MAHYAAYIHLIRADRPIGTYLVLWPTLSALWLAGNGHPSLKNIIIFCLGSWLMRSAGCAINDFADRKVDGKIARTKDRPLATGEISPTQALYTSAGLCVIAGLLVLQTNQTTVLWALAAAATATLYPFMKRFTHLPQVVLGIAFSFGIPMAFSAENAPLSPAIYVLWLANVIWIVAYDTFYAMADRDDDLAAGVKSTAVLFAHRDRSITAIMQLTVILLLQYACWQLGLGAITFSGIGIVCACFIYQQYLIRERDTANCLRAFQNNHLALLALFIALVLELSIS